ncbi:hypothetical protein MUCCIDRAFT_146649 [Mucor lusitanicus CBS 277.49]|uniref:GOLD domain-containing protein n=2 Tax=Mucor circinelloides f. lusitanicus TaxID=29924 RepID=A0A162QFD6_MUCCL|nr:hypothetical protein MUCCIDRAFT_146649 [Mucor lusitanicus CBS 277.49]
MAFATALSFILALSLLPCAVQATALTYKVGSKEKACFYVWNDKPGKKVGFYFAVQQGGAFDIDFDILDPKGESVLKGQEEKQGDYVFSAGLVGEYSFCFSNTMSTWADKLLDFEISIENEQAFAHHQASSDNENKPAKATDMEESLSRIASSVTKITRKQKYLRTRENRNFATVTSTESRIFWFASLESCAIVAMACVQVYVVKRFFSVKRGGV